MHITGKKFPESRTIYTQLGRPDDGTDPKGFNNIEIAVYLPPHDQWVTKGPDGKVVDKNGLIALMNQKLQDLPGLDLQLLPVHPEDNVEEALSGRPGRTGDQAVRRRPQSRFKPRARKSAKSSSQVPGHAELEVEQLSGQPTLTIRS